MKTLNSILFYALVTPALTLGATTVLAQEASVRAAQNEQNTQRTNKTDAQKELDRKTLPGQSNMHKRGYLDAVPANGTQASNLIGAEVRTANNEDIGEVHDLIIDSNGQVVAIVVSVGGFLGMGEKDVAIGWGEVTKTGRGDDQELRVKVTREELTSATTFAKRD